MIKQLRLLIGPAVALLIVSTALAQESMPEHTAPDWQVSYWNNTTLSGPSVLQRSETYLDHDWGGGSPAPGVNRDQFSARWTRYIDVPPGTYGFAVTADDGVRLWIDDELIIDQWKDQPATTYTAQKHLDAGHHLVRVEYYENLGFAVAKVSWTQAPQPIDAWRAEYYNNKSLGGSPVRVRNEQEINYHWGGSSPAPGVVNADGFSARWSRFLDLPAGNCRFTILVDDGARLYVNGHPLIDAWGDQPATTYSNEIYLSGGPTTLVMEYYENTGIAVARLEWAPTNTPPPPPPPPPDPTGIVTAHRLNARTGPGLTYPVVAILTRGEQVHLHGRNVDGSWLWVSLSGGSPRVWVHAHYIQSNVPSYELPVVR